MTSRVIKKSAILIEGLDAAGKKTKSTQLLNLLRASGRKADVISLPVYEAPWGRVIEAHLHKEIAPLSPQNAWRAFALDRLGVIEPFLEMAGEGIWVIFNRTELSNAYNLARFIIEEKKKWGRGDYRLREKALSVFACDDLFSLALKPLVAARIFYHLPSEMAAWLLEKRKKEEDQTLDLYEEDLYLQGVTARVYDELIRIREGGWMNGEKEEWKVISVKKGGELSDIEEVMRETCGFLEKAVGLEYDPKVAQASWEAVGL